MDRGNLILQFSPQKLVLFTQVGSFIINTAGDHIGIGNQYMITMRPQIFDRLRQLQFQAVFVEQILQPIYAFAGQILTIDFPEMLYALALGFRLRLFHDIVCRILLPVSAIKTNSVNS